VQTLVITPTYGRLPFLGRLLASFLSQTYDDKELVLVNDDKNITLVCEHPNVTVINMNKKLLIGQKKNLATNLGYHDLYLPHDDDDIFLPNRIANCVRIHKERPDINLYRNLDGYTVYGSQFLRAPSGINVISYTRKGFFESGGYTHPINSGEDQAFLGAMPNKLQVSDPNLIDYVYNYGGVNYHLTYYEDSAIENIAKAQLSEMQLTNGKFYIQPDFEEYNKFIILERLYKTSGGEPINVKHGDFGKLEIL
jgi:glycosyltransferase involved in cell wall biosynthesis